MLAMAEELGHEENLLWEDQAWAFPSLGVEENCIKNLAAENGSSDEQAAAKDEEEPPPPVSKGRKRAAVKRKEGGGDRGNERKSGGGGESDDHELHIWTERERRKKMRNMFANLHALLPHLPQKADKSTIVDEAVNYIKKLQQTFQNLQKQKLERLHGIIITNNPSIITQKKLAIQSREAFLAEQGSTDHSAVTLANPRPNPPFSGPEFPAIFKTWTSPNLILNVCGKDAHISICSAKKPGLLTAICFVMEKHKVELVSAQVSSDRNKCMYMIHAHANGIPDQFQHAFPVEEIYKQAAAEIMLWVNS
ncbi:hypothetical protein CDL12_18671 [Handroanthus impetiginosus]|uniref:BHLH domain-containing protein n=1 Tax=Handroanthus impetiginosus TaxID=429701 RepID=A0A2G9GTZ4_9LAMI|nr:hypothetical protein CDL12_18671 [Handroanthus impetiginosus]